MIVINLDVTTRAHLARALATHRQWCRVNGYAWPAALDDLGRLVARNGQEWPAVDHHDPPPDDVPMVPAPAAYTYAHAGEYLDGVSERTVRRLVAEGELPCVEVGGLRRIARADLEAFLDRQRREGNRA